jgi:UDP-N-acetylmuramoyl-L-alanyl-D-glutamate--2,6-diaminopimelate ligase
MKILGVTGTNGKTTTAYLTYQILNKLGKKTAYIGTIGFYIPGEDIVALPNTTPNILDLYELLLTAKSKKCEVE